MGDHAGIPGTVDFAFFTPHPALILTYRLVTHPANSIVSSGHPCSPGFAVSAESTSKSSRTLKVYSYRVAREGPAACIHPLNVIHLEQPNAATFKPHTLHAIYPARGLFSGDDQATTPHVHHTAYRGRFDKAPQTPVSIREPTHAFGRGEH